MRVLITTQPADGHLNPMLGLSAALRHAGHDVVFASSRTFAPRIEARGERAVAVGLDWLESDGAVEPPNPTTDPTGRETIFQRLFLRQVAVRTADDLLDVVRDRRPDVIVRESVEFAGAAVAERAGIPLATFDFSFPFGFDDLIGRYGRATGVALDELRGHVGLGPTSDRDWFSGRLRICTLPESYLGARHDGTKDVVIRPNVLRIVDDAVIPDWVGELEGAVYVSLGTIFTGGFPHVLEAAAAGAAALGHATVVTYGPSVELDALDLPDGAHVRIARYVPQGAVLDRCLAAVVHGGTGTVLGALARGVPVVVIPLGADQHQHAASVDRLGAGVVLGHDDLTPQLVAAAVREVLGTPSYRAAARRLATELASLPGPEHAIPALQRLVGTPTSA